MQAKLPPERRAEAHVRALFRSANGKISDIPGEQGRAGKLTRDQKRETTAYFQIYNRMELYSALLEAAEEKTPV